MDYLEEAKAITREFFPTLTQAQRMNDRRPTCIVCYAPCGLTREYRATKTCPTCYREELPPLTTRPKKLLLGRKVLG